MRIMFVIDGGIHPDTSKGKVFQVEVKTCIPKKSDTPKYLYYFGKKGDYKVEYDSITFSACFYSDCLEDLLKDLVGKIDHAIENYRKQIQLNIETMRKMKSAIEEAIMWQRYEEHPITEGFTMGIEVDLPDTIC